MADGVDELVDGADAERVEFGVGEAVAAGCGVLEAGVLAGADRARKPDGDGWRLFALFWSLAFVRLQSWLETVNEDRWRLTVGIVARQVWLRQARRPGAKSRS